MKSAEEDPHPLHSDTVGESSNADTARLAGLIRAHTPYDGSFELRVPGVHVARASRTNTELVHAVAEPSLCIIAQGAKSVMLGQEVYEYDASSMMIYSVDLPLAVPGHASEPRRALPLFQAGSRSAQDRRIGPEGVPPRSASGSTEPRRVRHPGRSEHLQRSNEAGRADGAPGDAELLAPLVIDEILIRLLRSPAGVRVAQIGLEDSGVNGVAKAVSWLRDQLFPAHESRRAGRLGAHERFLFSPALQVRHLNEPLTVPKGAASPGGEASHVIDDDGCRCCELACGVFERLAVQQGIRPLLRKCAHQGHRPVA